MRLNRTGYTLIALFTTLGVAMLVAGLLVGGLAKEILLINAFVWLAVVAGLYLYARQQQGKAEHERWLFENGIRGSGSVVGWDSNTAINDEPVVKLVLDLDVPGQQPRRIEHKVLMSRFAAYRMQPGVVLPVHVNPDPRKPGDLLVRW
jgi:hypothetical protein